MILAILIIMALGVLMAIAGTYLHYMFDDKKANIGTALQISGVITIIISIITSISCAPLFL